MRPLLRRSGPVRLARSCGVTTSTDKITAKVVKFGPHDLHADAALHSVDHIGRDFHSAGAR